MNFISHPMVVVRKNPLRYFLSFIVLLSLLATVFLFPYFTHAVAEELICDDGTTRTIAVGAFTDAAGSEFSSGADLTLSAAAGSCTFVLTQDENDAAIDLASFTLDIGVTLTHATSTNVADTYNKIDLNVAGNVTVSGTIDVSGKGFLGGRQGANASDSGKGEGNVLSSDPFNGGSHGGRGGKDNLDWTGEVYDSIKNPTLPGGGGGAGSADPGDEGGNGGGVVRLTAANILGNGNIYANGANSVYGAGAGGSIYLNAGGGDLGGISFYADGGDSTGLQGGGGGGRTALVNYTLNATGGTAFGGSSGADSGSGAAGTEYNHLPDDTYGTLSIDNNSTANAYYATTISSVLESDVTAEFGNALVFEEIAATNYGIVNIPSAMDGDDDGAVNFDRKIYVTSCTADNDDLSDGEILYDYDSGTGGENNDYTCVAPQHVLRFETTTSTSASESVTTGNITIETQGPASAEITFDMIAYNVSTTALSGTDFTTSTAGAAIAIGETTTTYSFTVVDDETTESSEDIVFEIANASAGSVTTTEPYYTYTIAASDAAGVTINEIGNTMVYEPDTSDVYAVVLDAPPSADVAIDLETSGQVTLSTSSLLFTPDTWDTPRVVTVTPVDDLDVEAALVIFITHTVSSSDGGYAALDPIELAYAVIDNDQISVTESGGSTTLDEGDPLTDTIDYVLELQPDSVVTINIFSDDEEVTSTVSTVSFTSENWDSAQTVTFTLTDNEIEDGNREAHITYTVDSDDADFDGAKIATTTIAIIDDDAPVAAGVTITESEASTDVTEGGATDTYSIVLSTEPTNDVTIDISTGVGIGGGEVGVSDDPIVFTSENWDTPQTITVTANNDDEAEGPHMATISHTATSEDLDYDGIDIDSVTVNITDNDTAGFTVSAISGNTTEAGGTATFTVVLTSEPAGIVTTTVHSSDTTEGTINTSTLVFDAFSWNLARTVTVTGVNDDLADGNIAYSIILDTATSTDDSNYDGINPANVAVTNTDNDEAGDGQSHNGGSARPRTSQVRTNSSSSTPTITPTPTNNTPPTSIPVREEPVFDQPMPSHTPTSGSVACALDIGRPYQAKNDSRVYMISNKIDENGNRLDGCVRWHLATPLYYFSYFPSWDAIDKISEEKLAAVPETNLSLRVLGPRFTPYNGSLVKKVGDDRIYYILKEKKYALTDEKVLSKFGFFSEWIQYINTGVMNQFPDGGNLSQNTAPLVGMVVTFASTPGQAFRVASNNGQLVGYNIGLIANLNDEMYRRDRISVIREQDVPPTSVDDGPPLERFLTFGAIGQDVRTLQRKLARLGYFTYESFTGRYGYETTRAVERFQRDHGIEPKGYVGPATRDVLNAL